MRNYIKKSIYLIVFIGFSSVNAGSFEDFFSAIQRDDPQSLSALLRRGFDPNTLDAKGQSGLFLALRDPSPKVVEVLLKAPKIKVETRTPQDESPLMMAAMRGELKLAAALIDKDADVNKTGWTPLHYAASSTQGDQLGVAKLLIENAAYIDAASPNGSTPLMMAAMYGNTSTLKLLLDEGADPTLKNQLGLTAVDFAQRADRKEMVELIGAAIRARQPKGKW
ncbi:MAG: ankyrin repeat domain-containing protein [Xylophilus sp.]|nr:ankyrin repeat domain-containing protein [Xylophilus sp.]